MATWQWCRLTGSGAPFSLQVESWTERSTALGVSEYNTMQSLLATLSGEIQGDFHADNRDQYAARRGIMVAQGPDFDVIDGGETGDGFGYTSTLTTSSTMMMPQIAVGNIGWWPIAHRGWAIGTEEGKASSVHDAPHALGTPPGGSDTNSIIFTKASWDAVRTDVEDWVASMSGATWGSSPARGYATLESYDDGKGLFWVSDGPWLSTTRGTDPEDDDCFYDFNTSSNLLTISWSNCFGFDVTANQNEFEFFIIWKQTGLSNQVTQAASRSQAFSANSGSVGYTDSSFDQTAGEGYASIHLKRKADGKICQTLSLRGGLDLP